ncbi:Tc toxin subunit A-related protein [Streptomyces sp. NPDC001002]
MTSEATEAIARTGVVSGRVTHADGAPAVAVTVSVTARKLRSAAPLGQVATDASGAYQLEFVIPAGTTAFVVEADAEGQDPVQVVRPVSGPLEGVDLTLAEVQGPSDYARLLAEVTPLLAGTALTDLVQDDTHDDLTNLAVATARLPRQIGDLAAATRLAQVTGRSAEAFYGLLSQDLPADIPRLAHRTTEQVSAALAKAADVGTIASAEGADAILKAVRAVDLGLAPDGTAVPSATASANGASAAPRSPLAAVFGVAVADPADRERLYNTYLDEGRSARSAAFVADRAHDDRLSLALHVGSLTDNNAPLVRSVLARFDSDELTEPRDLVKLDGAWEQLVTETGGAPRTAPRARATSPTADPATGATVTATAAASADDLSAYVEKIRTRVAKAYPTPHIAYKLASDPEHAEAPATGFLAANPDFDLITTPVTASAVPDPAARAELGAIQRTFKVAQTYDAMQALRAKGYTSSYDIASIGADSFARNVEGSLDAVTARQVHGRATQVHAAAVNLLAEMRTATQVPVPWLPGTGAATAADGTAPGSAETSADATASLVQVPDWEDLFGSADYAVVEEYRSVYGQGAYLVDLLYYLRRLGHGRMPVPDQPDDPSVPRSPTEDGYLALALYARRPDLWDLEITKENTELSVPYIDLVNELLESAVAPDTEVPAAERQSSGSGDELRIQPQFVNAAAYDKLRAAVFPWDLPFDLWREQTVTFLDHLGVNRRTLLDTLGTGTLDADRSSALRTAENLGLSFNARRIIAGEALTPSRSLAEFYGRPVTTSDLDLATRLSNVRTLLDTAGLGYGELTDLLGTRFVNPGRTLTILADAELPYDTTKMTLQGLSTAALDRLHRFVRLLRAVGGTAAELDRLIQAADGSGLLDAAALRSIAAARTLADRLNIPVEQVLSLVRPLDTYVHPAADEQLPLYDRLFLDASVVSTPPGQASPFALNADRTELAVTGSLDSPAVSAALLAVLQVSDAELTAMVGGPDAAVAGKTLNRANLTILHAVVTLARALDLSIPDLLRLARISPTGAAWAALAPTTASSLTRSSELGSGQVMSLPADSAAPPPHNEPAAGDLSGPAGGGTGDGPPIIPGAAGIALETLLASVTAFLDLIGPVLAAGFTVPDIDAVLTATYPATGGPVPDDAALATTLTALRAALQTVFRQTATDTDDKGTLTGKQLSLLGWDSALVQEAVSTLLGSTVYSTPLAALPTAVSLPLTLPVRYQGGDQPGEGRLLFTGPMDDTQKQQLLDLSAPTDTAYRTAVEALYQAPRTFVTGRMKCLRPPVFSGPLTVLPPGYQIPAALSGKVFYDATARALRSRTYLTAAELTSLSTAPGADSHVADAVTALGTAQEAPAQPGNAFLTADDLTPLFAPGVTPADRFHLALGRLNPYLRRTLSVTAVVQQLGQAAALDPAAAQELIAGALLNPAGKPVVEDFLLPEFAGSDTAVTVGRAAFGTQFDRLARIHRVALVVNRLRLTSDQIAFVVAFDSAGGWLDINALPSTRVPVAAGFPALRALTELISVRDATPGGMPTVQAAVGRALTTGAAVADVLGVFGSYAAWDTADLAAVAASRQLTAAAQLARPAALLALIRGYRLLGRLGVSGARATLWLTPEPTPEAGQAAWGAAKALHSNADWLKVAGPLQDLVRNSRRAALVSYLMANPLTYVPSSGGESLAPAAAAQDPVPHWTDSDGLHDYFLIDVEMSSGQLTTRVAQAVYTVQLFVQRQLMHLESVSTYGDDELWAQWEWMKQYQLWAANQKIFLYPENYFEPDLRADKSPIFRDLETELTQKDLTDDNVQEALANYLDGLDEVARLQPSGLYNDKAPNSAVGDYSGETVHVLARSESDPKAHYYRTWVNRLYWTPWQKVNLDINGDSMTMGMWNKRLYLFWPTFIPDADPQVIHALPDGTNTANDVKPAPKHWRIQLNWSEYRNGAWTPKRISGETLDTNIVLPDSYASYTDDHAVVAFSSENTQAYMFRPDVDYYSHEPVIWAHYNRSLKVKSSAPGAIASFSWVWGRFRLSKRRGTLVTDQLEWAIAEVGRRKSGTPDDPIGMIFGEGRYGLTSAPPGANTVNNDWVEDQSGKQVRNQLYAPYESFFYDSADASTAPSTWLLLEKTPTSLPFRVVRDHQTIMLPTDYLLMFADSERTYVMRTRDIEDPEARIWHYEFIPNYHPHVELLKTRLDGLGLDSIFDRDLQLNPEAQGVYQSFADRYAPGDLVQLPYPEEPFAFESSAPYAGYNWELFFHAPLYLAERLSTDQQFKAAQTWFHRIFDPTDRHGGGAPGRFWRTKPFYLTSTDPDDPNGYQQQRIEEILKRVAAGGSVESAEVDAWLADPFQPDVVARMRTTAYQKAVVMKYLDNLIAWGDQLFRQDTLESVNQATQLYILASELLGRRPDEVPQVPAAEPMTYRKMTSSPLSGGGTAGVAAAPVTDPAHVVAESLQPAAVSSAAPSLAPGLGIRWLDYFGIPRNEKLLSYWDTVDDRLFKIRNGQNIDGVVRQTALFGAVIDPSILVKATSAGVDLATVLDDMSAPLPHYRFGPMIAKAKEFTNEVKSFGAALLSALEKRDGEELARLRSTHELSLLNAALDVKKKQKTEAEDSYKAIKDSQAIAQDKERYYKLKTQNRLNDKEVTASDLNKSAVTYQTVAAGVHTASAGLSVFPEIKIGSPMTVGASFGGSNLSASLSGMANSIQAFLAADTMKAQQSATLGGYDHRWDDWDFQRHQAVLEVSQYDTQLTAAQVRKDIAQNELDNQKLQITNAQSDGAFLYSKYTNQELYDWMVGRLSTVYFQAYQLAYDVAKRAERAYRHELGLGDSNFIQFGYWDSLHKGLLSGERLAADLNRLDAAYYEGNAREFELSKRISLAQFDPEALLGLKETGRAYISLPEALFDLDTPGHYMRRIKSVSITVPSVSGPYSGVNLTATLLSSTVRVESRLNNGKYARSASDTRFRDFTGPIESIVTSTGQEDSGLFETNLRDERFLPFEGAGAIGEWQLSLPDEFRQFDYETISDVVLHVRYTARDGGNTLGTAAVSELRSAVNGWLHAGGGKGLHRTFSARREFPDQWSRFLATAPGTPAALTFTISRTRFPYLFRDETIKLASPELVLVLSADLVADNSKRYVSAYPGGGRLTVTLTGPGGTPHADGTLVADPGLGGQPHAGFDNIAGKVTETGQDWVITIPAAQIAALAPELLKDGRLNPDAVADMLLVWNYSVEKVNEA